ncbi:phospholipid/cholesterol/gamma-HCH transport system substrate-binding protein [Haloechinothrix alba]|uniref:Phospholipid/cholesterol/gamma-HCH transport system substrate-binding protein n=1 Tax=Haloechinothrix alba TaxID=664784 RepID=A0A239AI65_9PSEU|nr:MlaD family protein [Haloechinothrix alba]SNR94708.1 phospholipid/cholesterol/gamma-HCH transport system substrate-binding protein [Haloechinothrix alba]
MNAVRVSRPLVRQLITVFAAVAVFAGGSLFFWNQVGGPMPDIVHDDPYRVSFQSADVENLKEGSDVEIAGVVVGQVADVTLAGDSARVTLNLSAEAAPVHKGVTVRVGLKSIVSQSYVEVIDGDGAAIADGAALPASAVKPSVDINDLLSTLDPETRDALRGTVRSLGTATDGTSEDLSKLMTGLGKLGREGHTALDAIAAQSDDLKALTREATTLLEALDTGRGQIADVVQDARTLTDATAGQRSALEDTVRRMPELLASANTATGKLGELSGSLAPVAADLETAAPDLSTALSQLPAVTNDLRGLLPALDGTLDTAPATLKRVPTFGHDLRQLIPDAEMTLRDVNPMLAYLKPYGRDVGAMFASFGAALDLQLDNGIRPLRMAPIFNSNAIRGNPLSTKADPLTWTNPYPAPGQVGNPQPYRGEYPRVERAPK